MSISNLFVLHGIDFGTGTFISQISSSRVSPAIETIVAESAGFPQPLFVGNMGQKPMVSFDTTQVKSVLDTTGIALTDMTGANVDLYFKLTTNRASRVSAASGSHFRFRMANAVLEWQRISAGHRSEATISCVLHCPYDGTNEPIVPAGSVSLSGDPTSSEHYVVGPCYFNGTEFAEVQDLTIDSGRTLIQTGSAGELYDTFICEQRFQPSVSVRGLGTPWFGATLNGTALTSMSVYLRALATTGRASNAASSHIKFAGTTGYIYPEDASGGGNEPAVTSLRVQLNSSDASTNALTLTSTATAITS